MYDLLHSLHQHQSTKINPKVHDQKSSLIETGKSENPTIDYKDKKNLKKNRDSKLLSPYFSPYPFIASGQARAKLEPKGCNIDKGLISKLFTGCQYPCKRSHLRC